MMNFGVS